MKDKKTLYLSYYIMASLIFLAAYACYEYRSLTFDGARWFIQLTDYEAFVIDSPHLRFSNAFIQIPSLLFVKWHSFNDRLLWAFYSFNFIYTCFHLVGFFVAFIYLKAKSKLSDIYFVIAIYLFALLPATTFPTNSINEAVCVFVPLLIYQIYGVRNLWYYFIFLIGCVYLAFSYPFSMFLIAVLIINLLLKSKKREITKANLYLEFPIVLLSFLIKIGLNFRIYLITKDLADQKLILHSIVNNFKTEINVLLILFILIFIVLIFINIFKKKIKTFYVLPIVIVLVLLYVFTADLVNYKITWREGFDYRGLVGPIVALMSFLYIIFKYFDSPFNNEDIIVYFLIFTSMFVFYRDFSATKLWGYERGLIANLDFQNKKCLSLSLEDFYKKLARIEHLSDVMIPFHMFVESIVKKDNKVLFVNLNQSNLLFGADICKNYHPAKNQFISSYEEGHAPSFYQLSKVNGHPKNFDFEQHIFSMAELKTCEEIPKAYLFENYFIAIDTNELEINSKYKVTLNLRSNEHPLAQTTIVITLGDKKIIEIPIEGDYKDYSFELPVGSHHELLKISFKNFHWFKDKYHENFNNFILRCIKLDKITQL